MVRFFFSILEDRDEDKKNLNEKAEKENGHDVDTKREISTERF